MASRMAHGYVARSIGFGLLAAMCGCSAPSLDVTPRVMWLDLEGELGASTGAISGTTSWDRIGLDEEPTAPAIRGDLHAGPLDLTVDAMAVGFEGTGETDAQLDLDGVTIPIATTVDSELDLAALRLTSTWDLVPGELVTIGVGVGLAVVDVSARIENTGNGDTIESDEIVPLPYGAVRIGLDLGALEFEGLGSILAVDVGDSEASYLDVDALARWRILGGEDRVNLSIAAGYRFSDIEIEYDDGSETVRIDAQLSGPWVGATITF